MSYAHNGGARPERGASIDELLDGASVSKGEGPRTITVTVRISIQVDGLPENALIEVVPEVK